MQYTIRKNPRSKRISIKVDQECNVVVTAPKLTPNFLIDAFIKQLKQVKNIFYLAQMT